MNPLAPSEPTRQLLSAMAEVDRLSDEDIGESGPWGHGLLRLTRCSICKKADWPKYPLDGAECVRCHCDDPAGLCDCPEDWSEVPRVEVIPCCECVNGALCHCDDGGCECEPEA